MKKIALSLTVAALMLAADGPQTITGTITENMCGGNHKAMDMGPDEKCITECVKTMGAKYALWDGKTAYELSDQKGAAKFAAKKVTIKGNVDEKAKTIQVTSIAAAK
ncbi:conserved exported hypothetical protein [Candidatus Sulfopaludibacter sp. SbA3]|nr:conserved exported hypothetical protein [Candidatus Sulfopaludibacter sp. SbA3]